MKKTLLILLVALATLFVFVACNPAPPEKTDPNATPLTLEFYDHGGRVTFVNYEDAEIWFSINDGEKKRLTTSFYEVADGERISLFVNRSSASIQSEECFRIECGEKCYVYGNVMSLIDAENYAKKTDVFRNAFDSLFSGNTRIENHPDKDLLLPATELDEECYYEMFRGCTGLTKGPELPATTLTYECYMYMFRDCSGLIKPPVIAGTKMDVRSCAGMFLGCRSLTESPVLHANIIEHSCYVRMFEGCSSLTTVTCLASTIDFYSTMDWLKDVPSKGTFYVVEKADGWVDGANGIPKGWTKIVYNQSNRMTWWFW